MTAIGAGFILLGFFHLLSHAFFKALLFIRAGNLIHRSESFQDLRVIGGNGEIIPFRKRIIIGASLRLCGLPFISAFYSKEIIIERLLVHHNTIYSYILIILGVFITVFYSIRLFIISITWVNRQRSLLNKSDFNIVTNIRMLLLLAPAVIGGAVIRQKLRFSPLFLLINPLLKYTTLSFFIIRGILFFLFYKNSIFFFKKIIWGAGSIWGLPFISSRFPINRVINLGDYLHKYIDFSWIFYLFTNFIFRIFKIQISKRIIFINHKFIRIINNIFFLIIFSIYIFW